MTTTTYHGFELRFILEPRK